MSLDTIRVFAISKLPWIRREQHKMQDQDRESPREYLDRESHYVWGRRYLLKVSESDRPPSVKLKHNRMHLRTRQGAGSDKRRDIIEAWFREELKRAAVPLIAKWESVLGVKAERFFVQRMKTKWGSCNPPARSIRLNSELAKKPRECLEYVLVHELIHLLEPTHNARFLALMDRFVPRWQLHRQILNRLPVRHEKWDY